MALDSPQLVIHQHVVDVINEALHMQWFEVIHVVWWLLENSLTSRKLLNTSRDQINNSKNQINWRYPRGT
jgi:hypothetical protein